MPNIARNCIVNIGEIVVYDVCKEALLSNKILSDGIPCHFTAAVMAGFCATLVASPVDVIKTRWKTQAHNSHLCPVVKERDIRLFLIPWAKVIHMVFSRQVHEQSEGSVSWSYGLCHGNGQKRRLLCVLQGFQCIIHQTCRLEHLPLDYLRTVQKRCSPIL